MVDRELHISERLAAILPPLTEEERADLRRNIIEDGRIIDAILYWWDGKRNVVMDGMHRYQVALEEGLDYRTEPVIIEGGYEGAERWILNHQLGKRNLTPDAIRRIRGELYNRMKRPDKGHGDQKSGCQIVTPIRDAAKEIAEKTGVSIRTVKRDGARVEALQSCVPAVRKGIESGAFKASDTEIAVLAKLPPEDQTAVATALRKGGEATVSDAIIGLGIKTPKAGKKKPAKQEPPVKALEGPELAAFTARQVVKTWTDTIGRWLSGPPSIDDERNAYPGKQADAFLAAAKQLYEAGNAWGRAIK